MKKLYIILVTSIIIIFAAVLGINEFLYQDPFYFIKPGVEVPKLVINNDKDKDGIYDLEDIVVGARKEAENKTTYKSAYYIGGYPPISEGVCTDVVIRALKNAGYDLKYEMDKDIKNNTKDYSGAVIKPDPNIDFRRVKNQIVFFKKNAINLTQEVIPYNIKNLSEWQGGDIVVLKDSDHVAIISDKRRKDGVPYVIHNSYPSAKENDRLRKWYLEKRIIGHFRYIEH